jgi:hypothetical protein
MSLFRTPKQDVTPAPDPSELANRRDSERRNRLAAGGTQSTLLAKAMAGATGQPTSTLTGIS